MKSLSGCGNFIKYSIFIVNFAIFIAGLAVVGLGIWVLAGGADVRQVLGTGLLTSSAAILMSFGGVVSFISFLGCCGAIKEVRCLLLTFFIILLLVSILIVAGVIVAVKLQDKAKDFFQEGIMETLKEYSEKKDVQEAWDAFQRDMHCCGVTSSDDWIHNKFTIPQSCVCEGDDKESCTGQYWNKGCYDELIRELKKYAKPLIISGIFLAVIIVISMVFSCSLFMML